MHNCYSSRAYMHGYCSMCILYFNSFWFAPFFSLSSSSAKLTLPLMFFFPLIPHTPTDTKSKINYKNKKSTTKSTKKINNWNKIVGSVVLMEIGDGLMLICFDGDRWWVKISVDGDRCWWSACNGLMEKRKEKDSQKKKKRRRRRRRGGYRDKDGVKKGLFRGKKRVLMECLWWVDGEEEEKKEEMTEIRRRKEEERKWSIGKRNL